MLPPKQPPRFENGSDIIEAAYRTPVELSLRLNRLQEQVGQLIETVADMAKQVEHLQGHVHPWIAEDGLTGEPF